MDDRSLNVQSNCEAEERKGWRVDDWCAWMPGNSSMGGPACISLVAHDYPDALHRLYAFVAFEQAVNAARALDWARGRLVDLLAGDSCEFRLEIHRLLPWAIVRLAGELRDVNASVSVALVHAGPETTTLALAGSLHACWIDVSVSLTERTEASRRRLRAMAEGPSPHVETRSCEGRFDKRWLLLHTSPDAVAATFSLIRKSPLLAADVPSAVQQHLSPALDDPHFSGHSGLLIRR